MKIQIFKEQSFTFSLLKDLIALKTLPAKNNEKLYFLKLEKKETDPGW